MSFFDRMKDSVTLAGVGASKKVSCTADTIKLNNSIRDNEKEIEKLTYQVGVKCVEQHLRDENSEYEELFSQIRRYTGQKTKHIERKSGGWRMITRSRCKSTNRR